MTTHTDCKYPEDLLLRLSVTSLQNSYLEAISHMSATFTCNLLLGNSSQTQTRSLSTVSSWFSSQPNEVSKYKINLIIFEFELIYLKYN